jgi:hypothetical protein
LGEEMIEETGRLYWAIFPFFWVILGILGFFLFYVNNNAEFKKKYFPWYVIMAGVIFGICLIFAGMPPFALIIFIPAIALITFLNLHFIKFCSSCGKTISTNTWPSKVKYCSNCGAKLDEN